MVLSIGLQDHCNLTPLDYFLWGYVKSMPKCEVRYGPTHTQHRQKFSEDWLPISCRCWNDNSGTRLAANSGPMLRQTLVFSLPECFAVVKVTHGSEICCPGPDSDFSTFRTGCRSESDNRLGIGPILSQVSAEGRSHIRCSASQLWYSKF